MTFRFLHKENVDLLLMIEEVHFSLAFVQSLTGF